MKVTQSAFMAGILALGMGVFFLAACQTRKHHMIEAKPGARVICQRCYDEITTVDNKIPFDPKQASAFIYRDRMIKRHQCSDCGAEMTVYEEGGVRKVKCPKCAPEGLACDKCLPPHVFKNEQAPIHGG